MTAWRETRRMQPRKALCLAMAATRVLEKVALGNGGIWTQAPKETWALMQRLRPLGHATLCAFVRRVASTGKRPDQSWFCKRVYWPKRIAGMHCKSLWIKVSAKCINVNVPREAFVPWVASTGNRRIWKNRSTQNWLKSSAKEPQIVSKPHRKDVAPGAGLSYPA